MLKLSEIQLSDVVEYLRLEQGQYGEKQLQMMMDAAKAHIESRTGLDAETLDKYEDVSIAYLVLIQDFFENRSMQVDKSNANLVIDSILSMHRDNFLPKVKA